MKCPKCGYVSFDNLTHCKRCGKELSPEAHTGSQQREFTDNAFSAGHRDQGGGTVSPPPQIHDTLESIKQDLDELGPAPGGKQTADGAFSPEQDCDHEFHCEKTETVAKAGFFIRLVAYTVDNLILAVISGVLFFITYRIFKKSFMVTSDSPAGILTVLYGPFLLVSSIIQAFYFIYFHAVTGQTVGKLVCGIRVIGKDGNLLGIKRSILRYLGYVLSCFVFYLGFLWIAFDSQKQGWHDKIAGSYVVK